MADGNIIELYNKNNMTPEECLELCLRNVSGYSNIIVIGWGKDGEFFHHSSQLSKGDANWLIDAAKQEILTGEVKLAHLIEEENKPA